MLHQTLKLKLLKLFKLGARQEWVFHLNHQSVIIHNFVVI